MQIKKFVLHAGDDGLQEQELNRFLRGHRVLKIEQAFVPNGEYWAILVTYMDGQADVNEHAPVGKRGNSEREDPTKDLTAEQKSKYERFAEVRLNIARREGVKAFHIFTNAELASICKLDTLSVPNIGKLEGVGEKRAEKYGYELIKSLDVNETGRIPDAEDNPF